jgi:hypothetical protein
LSVPIADHERSNSQMRQGYLLLLKALIPLNKFRVVRKMKQHYFSLTVSRKLHKQKEIGIDLNILKKHVR